MSGYDDLEAQWFCDDPAREAMDYEFNAHFDRWDGWDCGERDYHADRAELDAWHDAELRDELDDYQEIDENGVPADSPVCDDEVPF